MKAVGPVGDVNSDGYKNLYLGAQLDHFAARDGGRVIVLLGGLE